MSNDIIPGVETKARYTVEGPCKGLSMIDTGRVGRTTFSYYLNLVAFRGTGSFRSNLSKSFHEIEIDVSCWQAISII
jgi:hypothetical protein